MSDPRLSSRALSLDLGMSVSEKKIKNNSPDVLTKAMLTDAMRCDFIKHSPDYGFPLVVHQVACELEGFCSFTTTVDGLRCIHCWCTVDNIGSVFWGSDE